MCEAGVFDHWISLCLYKIAAPFAVSSELNALIVRVPFPAKHRDIQQISEQPYMPPEQ